MNDHATRRLQRLYNARLCIAVVLLLACAPISIIDSDRALSRMWNNPALWLPPDMPARARYESFEKLFGRNEVILIAWEGSKVGSDELTTVKNVLLPYTKATEDREAYFNRILTGDDLLDQMKSSPNRFSDAAARGRLRGAIVGPDGEQTIVLASTTEAGVRSRRWMLETYRQEIADALTIPPENVYFAGPPVEGAIIDQEAYQSIQQLTIPSFLLGAAICVICLRSFLLSAAVLSVAMLGQAASLAAVRWADLDMNAILIVLPPLVFVLTASAGIHLCNYYLDTMRSVPGIDPTEATRRAMAAGVVPCWLAASTTIVGLGSLGLVRLWPVSAFGLIAAAAVLITLLLLLAILPGTMQLHGQLLRRKSNQRIAQSPPVQSVGFWRRLSIFNLDHARFVVILFAIITIVSATGLPYLTTSVNIARMFPPGSRIRTDAQWFEENIGPTVNAEILIAFAPGSIPDPLDRFMIVRDIDDLIRKLDSVGGVISPRTFLPTPPAPDRRSVSATAQKAAIRSQISGDDSPLLDSGYFAHDDSGDELWRISFRFPFNDVMDYRAKFKEVQSQIDPQLQSIAAMASSKSSSGFGRGVRAIYTGSVPLTTTSQDILLRDLFRSFLSAFAIVGVMMMFVLRSVVGGLLAMFPNLFPTVVLFGFMGLGNMPLDIGSVMTASVALGIAVDGTVHLLARFQEHRLTHPDRRDAVLEALKHCGPAMWQTTAVCAISPIVYALSDFIPTQRFAIMMFGLLFAALIGDTILLPAILVSPLGRWFRPPGAVMPHLKKARR